MFCQSHKEKAVIWAQLVHKRNSISLREIREICSTYEKNNGRDKDTFWNCMPYSVLLARKPF